MAIAEGKIFEWKDVSHIKPDFLEVFEFNEIDEYIKISTPEFSAVCPFSGLPDIAKVIIEYKPKGRKCIELKSLKYYFLSFRDVGLYQEGITSKIYHDLTNILETANFKITTIYNTRGGIDVECSLGELY